MNRNAEKQRNAEDGGD